MTLPLLSPKLGEIFQRSQQMNIVFPTTEPRGLQAKRALYFENAMHYTLVKTNDKGAITTVKNIEAKELESIKIDTIVSKFPLQSNKFSTAKVYIDALSVDVDKALVKVLQEELFCKSA